MSMIGAEHRSAGRRQSRAQLERDAALQRVSRVRRWLILAAGALSCGLAALVASVAPGHKLGAHAQAATLSGPQAGSASARASSAGAPASSATQMPPLASPGDLGLQGPSSSPQASSDPSQAQNQASAGVQPDPSQSGAAVQNPAAVAPASAPVVSGGS
jgi:hypothetical protein